MAVGISLIHHDLWQCLQLFLSSIYFLSSAIFCCFLQKFIKQDSYHSVEGWCDHESPEASFRMFLDHPSTQTRGGRFLSLSKLRLGWCLKLGCGWKTQTCNGTSKWYFQKQDSSFPGAHVLGFMLNFRWCIPSDTAWNNHTTARAELAATNHVHIIKQSNFKIQNTYPSIPPSHVPRDCMFSMSFCTCRAIGIHSQNTEVGTLRQQALAGVIVFLLILNLLIIYIIRIHADLNNRWPLTRTRGM